MATWKEMRALQAAARAAEAQRQTETARGQRELRGLEQTLGLVDQLIGLAPQAIEGYQAGEAQKILAGERGLEREKPKQDDILGQIGAFIASPFEEGVQRKAKMAAGRMAPERLQQVEPLLREAIRKPQPRDAARAELMRDPALALLPQQQQEAAIAGLEQRMAAEQAAAEREQQLFDLKRKGLEAKPGVAKATTQKIGVFVDAGLPAVSKTAKDFRDQLNSDQPETANRAADEIAKTAEAALQPFVDSGQILADSPEYAAAKGQLIEKASKKEKKETPAKNILDPFIDEQRLINNLLRLTRMRRDSGWNPSQERIIQQEFLEGLDFFGLESLPDSVQKVQDRLNMTKDQKAFFSEAQALRREIMVALNGPGVLSNQDVRELAKAALNPFSTNEEWIASSNAMIERVGSVYESRYNAYSGIYAMPSAIGDFIDKMPKSVGEIKADDIPMGGATEAERQGVAQRAIEQTVNAFLPFIAAATSLTGQGTESIMDQIKSYLSSAFDSGKPTDPSMVKMQVEVTSADGKKLNMSVPISNLGTFADSATKAGSTVKYMGIAK